MPVSEGNTRVLSQPVEMDSINYLRESDRLGDRRAKIEDIRARMKNAEKKEGKAHEEKGATEPIGVAEADTTQATLKRREISGVAGDMASAAGSGCKFAPCQGVFKLKNTKPVRPSGKIYKHVSGDTFGWKLLSKKPMNPSKKIYRPDTSSTGKVAIVNHLGTALIVAGVAMDAYEVYTAAKQDYEEGTKHNTVHAVSGIAGSWAGALPGAAYGATIGSTVPVVGSIIGGVVGGIVGSLSGGYLANTVAETLMPAPTKDSSFAYEAFVTGQYKSESSRLDDILLFNDDMMMGVQCGEEEEGVVVEEEGEEEEVDEEEEEEEEDEKENSSSVTEEKEKMGFLETQKSLDFPEQRQVLLFVLKIFLIIAF